jgi:hypothetical protein
MRKSEKLRRELKTSILIYGDGETEKWYFQAYNRYLDNVYGGDLKIKIIPEFPKRKKLEEIKDEIKKSLISYDKIFWIVDFDKIIDDKKIDSLKKIEDELSRSNKVVIIKNNPCLEYWFYLHFKYIDRKNNCHNFVKELKEFLPDYDKSERYFLKENNDIFTKLKHKYEFAIENSKQSTRNLTDDMLESKSFSEMFKFFETINELMDNNSYKK